MGDGIVTASGTTLLGADDKAGVAIVMTVAQHLLQNRRLPHGHIRIAFTPDEEIGRGIHRRFSDDLNADVAYTLDGTKSDAMKTTVALPKPDKICSSVSTPAESPASSASYGGS